MRGVLIAAMAVAGTVAAFAISQLSGGIVAAAAFMLALFIPTVAIGLALAECSGGRLERWELNRPRRLPRRLQAPNLEISRSCGECGQPQSLLASIWVCHTCDQVPARS